MIRVLHIVGKMDRAGAETMLMNLYRHIDRTQVQFDFITFTIQKGDYDDEILALGGKIIPIMAKNPIDRMFKLAQFLKKHPEYQIVHAHTLLSNAFHMLAAKIAGVQHRITHSHSTNGSKTGVINIIYENVTKLLISKLATEQIACGEEAAEYLFKTSKDVWVLKNAIDLEYYQNIAVQSREYWTTINSEVKNIKIIQVGRLSEVKNHLFSLDIARQLRDKGVKFTFFIVGQGPLECLIQEKIQEYKLEKNVFMLGVRSDVPQLMAGADVMLMPSLHEGFPVVLVESQAVGLKSLISDRIAREVDLNLNLVNFLSLNNVNSWLNAVTKQKAIFVSESDISKCLQDNCFDVKKNSEDLLDYYKKLSTSSLRN